MSAATWLFKSDPDDFSFADLQRAPAGGVAWDGIRNAEARNFLRDGVAEGDRVLIYASSAKPAAIVGVARVVRRGYPDPTAFQRGHAGFDPKSDRAKPTWYAVDVEAVAPLARTVTLEEIKAHPELRDMVLVKRGRLSVQPVTPREWQRIAALAATAAPRSSRRG